MDASLFFYDLETTGVRWRDGRIMQFAGQRTNLELEPIGEPFNIVIKLTPDVLPDPEAVLLTGITPQQTLADGISEYEFLQIFTQEIATRNTIFVGYNNVRFDDEFMRCLHYRNFYNPYAWNSWDDRSRWDLLDVVRLTRALRPDGIEWPVTEEGKPTNRLELLTKSNGLDHDHAHDALSDVSATIALARLIRQKQPKLFDTMLELRAKQAVKEFLGNNKTFVYASGKYADDCCKTAVVQLLYFGDDRENAIVYDLRHDPTEFVGMSPEQLAERWRYTKETDAPKRLPVKTLKYNRCPALCPAGLIADEAVQKRLQISLDLVNKHKAILHANPQLMADIIAARKLLDAEREKANADVECEVEERMYDGFLGEADAILQRTVRAAAPEDLHHYADRFQDERMRELLPRYKARNFPESLTDDQRSAWEAYRNHKLFDGGNDSLLAKYFQKLAECAANPKYADKQFLLEELQLYGQSLLPAEMTEAA